MIYEYLGADKSIPNVHFLFHLVLIFKPNIAPGGHLENGILSSLAFSALGLIDCEIFWDEEVIFMLV